MKSETTPFASVPVFTGRASPVEGAPPLAELVAAARGMVPYLAGRASQTERDRRVSEETIRTFRDAGFFRLMQPAAYGGYEYGFSAFIDVVSELGRGCTSSAWSCSLGIIHQWLIALFPKQAQDDVWGADAEAIACGSYAPAMTAEAVDGGYLIHGKWLYASNVDNSQWAALGVHIPPAEPGGAPSGGFMLCPRADWEIEDNWHVAGQSGTGSKTIVIDKPTFIPAHRKLTFAQAASGKAPGASVHSNPMYRITFLSAVPVTLISPLLGTAQGAVDALVELCDTRVTRGAVNGAGNRLSQFFPVQSRIAEAAASVDAARLLLYRDVAEIEERVGRGEAIDIDMRIRNRRDHAFATRLAQSAVEAVFGCVGGNGLSLEQPIQRMWRDSNAIARHITLNWDAVSSMVGQHMLGLEPKGQY